MDKDKNKFKKRVVTLFFVFMLGFSVLAVRLFQVQILQGEELAAKAMQNRSRNTSIAAKRGNIYDRNYKELAISIDTDSVYINPAEVRQSENSAAIVTELSEVLGVESYIIAQKVQKDSSFEWIKRKVDTELANQLKNRSPEQIKLTGVYFTPETRRFYPKGTLASQILGIVGMDNNGLEGLEKEYDRELSGIAGELVSEYDARGRLLNEATSKFVAPVDGMGLVLTIDEGIQYIAEQEIDKAFKDNKAQSAIAIVMDPRTAEVLAMASRPNFDPNDYAGSQPEDRSNKAISFAYEPGSTMKIVTAAMALEAQVANLNSTYDCPGVVQVGINTIKCSEHRAHGHQTFSQILGNSCNVGFVKVGMALGKETYFKYLHDFGFGQLTGIDLNGETPGIIVDENSARDIDLATMAIGQANAVTPLQLVSAVCAVVNGGKLMQPHVVKTVLDAKGRPVREIKPQVIRRVISKAISQQMCSILEEEVLYGTGKNAYIEGFRVGGKTGTAQKIDPAGGYKANEFIVSFIGIAPMNNPRLVCLVLVDDPKVYPVYGGTVAAPVVRNILKDSLLALNEPLAEQLTEEKQPTEQRVSIPDVVNMTPADAISHLEDRGLYGQLSEIYGEGDIIWRQEPAAGTVRDRGSTVRLMVTNRNAEINAGEFIVPDFTGKSMREVNISLTAMGLNFSAQGSGLACGQKPAAGQKITAGSTVQVKFAPAEEAQPVNDSSSDGAAVSADEQTEDKQEQDSNRSFLDKMINRETTVLSPH